MKKSTVVWMVLGGLALLTLGFAVGFFTNGGGWAYGMHRPLIGAWGGTKMGGFPMMGGFPFHFWGIGWLFMALFWLGPLAGIVALIIVLTRKGNSAPAQPPAAPSQPAASDATAPSNPTKPK